MPDRYSRRKHRDGAISLASRIDRGFLSVGTQVTTLVAERAPRHGDVSPTPRPETPRVGRTSEVWSWPVAMDIGHVARRVLILGSVVMLAQAILGSSNFVCAALL